MNKKFYFLSGLPRSGSTLLAAVLTQNPAIYTSGTSGILGMIENVRNFWPKISEFKALLPDRSTVARINTLRGMLHGYYADIEKPVIVDKCRSWLSHMEMAQAILGAPPKVIVTVRDIRDVLASFERKYRETKTDTQVSQEELNPANYASVKGRCEVLCRTNQVVGSAVTSIRDAVARGWRKNMLFVEYDQLCAAPHQELARIYEFLEIEGVSHDPEHVDVTAKEADEAYSWKNLHQIRGVIQKQEPQWPIYLPRDVADIYKPEAQFWRSL